MWRSAARFAVQVKSQKVKEDSKYASRNGKGDICTLVAEFTMGIYWVSLQDSTGREYRAIVSIPVESCGLTLYFTVWSFLHSEQRGYLLEFPSLSRAQCLH